MKQCNVCKQFLSLDQFNKSIAKKDGLCGTCREYSKQRNKQSYKKQKQEKLPAINSQKQKCLVCGESRLPCLDFHHKNPERKKFSLSKYKNHTKEEILKEIEKCVCLCNNCHRKYHGNLLTKNYW